MRKLVFAALAALLLLGLAVSAVAADVSGTWKITAGGGRGGRGPGGAGPAEQSLVLKQDGSSLSGKMVVKRGEQTVETNIQDGKVDGDNIEFKVKRNTPNGEMVTAFKAKVSGDKMEGTRTMNDRERPFTATREK